MGFRQRRNLLEALRLIVSGFGFWGLLIAGRFKQPAISRPPKPIGGDDQSPRFNKDSSVEESISGQNNSGVWSSGYFFG